MRAKKIVVGSKLHERAWPLEGSRELPDRVTWSLVRAVRGDAP